MFVRRKDAEREAARRLRAEGLSVRRIASRLGVSIASVSVWVRDVPLPPAPVPAAPQAPAGPEPLRRCPRCDVELPLSAYNRNGEGHQHWCRECFRTYFSTRGDLHREQVRRGIAKRRAAAHAHVLEDLRDHPCVDCGEDELLVLEFDHHRGEKTRDISRLVAEAAGLPRLRRELERCEVVCANCHRRRTATRGGWFRVTGRPPETWTSGQRRNQLFLRELLQRSSCVDCGEGDHVVLEFDHVGNKRGEISKLAGWCSLAVLERELAVCEIRCCNCHRLKTSAAGTWRDRAPWAS